MPTREIAARLRDRKLHRKVRALADGQAAKVPSTCRNRLWHVLCSSVRGLRFGLRKQPGQRSPMTRVRQVLHHHVRMYFCGRARAAESSGGTHSHTLPRVNTSAEAAPAWSSRSADRSIEPRELALSRPRARPASNTPTNKIRCSAHPHPLLRIGGRPSTPRRRHLVLATPPRSTGRGTGRSGLGR